MKNRDRYSISSARVDVGGNMPRTPYRLEMANNPIPMGIARIRLRFDGESPH